MPQLASAAPWPASSILEQPYFTSPRVCSLRDSRLLPDIRARRLINTLGAYKRYAQATGGVLDEKSKLLRITQAQYKSLQSLNFVIGGETFGLTPDAQIWPGLRDKDYIYLAVQDIGEAKALNGIDFICGMTFLDRFYSVFDYGHRRIGLARTAFTNATANYEGIGG